MSGFLVRGEQGFYAAEVVWSCPFVVSGPFASGHTVLWFAPDLVFYAGEVVCVCFFFLLSHLTLKIIVLLTTASQEVQILVILGYSGQAHRLGTSLTGKLCCGHSLLDWFRAGFSSLWLETYLCSSQEVHTQSSWEVLYFCPASLTDKNKSRRSFVFVVVMHKGTVLKPKRIHFFPSF